MAPKPQYRPTRRLKFSCDFSIPIYGLFNLGNPEITIALNFVLSIFPIVSMPEVPVTKNSDFSRRKSYIWLSEDGFIVTLKCRYTVANKLFSHLLFKSSVAIAHTAHIVPDFFFTLFTSHGAHLLPLVINRFLSACAKPMVILIRHILYNIPKIRSNGSAYFVKYREVNQLIMAHTGHCVWRNTCHPSQFRLTHFLVN